MFSQRTNWKLTQNRYTQAVEEARKQKISFIDLTISNPTQCGLHYDSAAILKAFVNPQVLSYDPQPKGVLSARHQVVNYYSQDHNTAVDPESVFLTTSTSEAYSFLFRLLCNPQDEVLVPKPSYPLFDFLAELQDVRLIPYPLEYAQGWLIDFKSLAAAITPRARAILLVHPNNPTGSCIRAEETVRLNELCREHNLALIVDEVFLDYSFAAAPVRSFASNRQALTFTLSGLSKVAALPQMKIAWIAVSGPENLVTPATQRLEVIADTYLSMSAPQQLACPNLFSQRFSLRSQLLQRVRANRAELQRQLTSNPRCELLDADAGWYAVLRARTTRSDEDIAIDLLQKKQVLVHPGHFYDFHNDGSFVLSLIGDPAEFRTGIARLKDFSSELQQL
jgi:alanine-synthesizing transaminase